MGYLDEVRQAAERSRGVDAASQLLAAQREEAYVEKIRPAMLATLKQLRELASLLPMLTPPAEMAFQFPGITERQVLLQQHHRVHIDSNERPMRIRFSFSAHAPSTAQYPLSAAESARLTTFLSMQRVYCSTRPALRHTREEMVVEAQLGVHAQLEVVADIEASRVLVETINFRQPGFQMTVVPAERAGTEEWADRLAGFILGKIDTLIPPRHLNDEERLRLRRRFDEVHEQRRMMARAAAAAANEDARLASTADTAGRGLFARLATGLLRKA